MSDTTLTRPPIHPGRMMKKCLLMIGCFAVGLFLIITSLRLCQEYRQRKARAVTVQAVVVYVESVSRADDTDYDVYVSYDYNGEQYTRRYISSLSASWMDRIGEQVEMVVDSAEPSVQIEDMIDSLFFAYFFGLPIFAAGFSVAAMRCRTSYTEQYGLTETALFADAAAEERRKLYWLTCMTYSVGMIAWGIYIVDINGIFAGAIMLGVMTLPFGLIMMVSYFKVQAYMKNYAQNYVKSS